MLCTAKHSNILYSGNEHEVIFSSNYELHLSIYKVYIPFCQPQKDFHSATFIFDNLTGINWEKLPQKQGKMQLVELQHCQCQIELKLSYKMFTCIQLIFTLWNKIWLAYLTCTYAKLIFSDKILQKVLLFMSSLYIFFVFLLHFKSIK